jgi:hypothetical protein
LLLVTISIASAQLIRRARQIIIHFLLYSLLSSNTSADPYKRHRNVFNVPELERIRLFVRSGCMWEDVIKRDIKEVVGLRPY